MIPNINVDPSVLADIRATFSGTEGKAERCGILLGRIAESDYHVTGWAEVPNRSDDPNHLYKIDTGTARAAAGKRRIIGSVHTHNRGIVADPSDWDVIAMPPNMLGGVYHVTTGKITWFDHEFGYIRSES